MDEQQKNWQKADEAVSGLAKDFTIVGRHRVHSWYAWAIVGIVFGMALGIIYVANRSAQFDSSQAATMLSKRTSVPERPSLPTPSLTIIYPRSKMAYTDNPIFFVRSDFGPLSAEKIKWTSTRLDMQGRAVGQPEIMQGNYRQGIVVPQHFVFVATSFKYLPSGTYEIKASKTNPPYQSATVTLSKPNAMARTTTAPCVCTGKKVIPLTSQYGDEERPDTSLLPTGMKASIGALKKETGQSFLTYPFKAIFDIDGDSNACSENQEIQMTVTYTDKKTGKTETVNSIGFGPNAALGASQGATASEAAATGATTFPYDESTDEISSDQPYTSDDYTNTSLDNKWHGKNIVYWYDSPGATYSPKTHDVTVKARFIHNVDGCKCKTKIYISSKGASKFETDCP